MTADLCFSIVALSRFLDPKVAEKVLADKDKMDIDTIAKLNGLSISEIEELQGAVTPE